VIFLNIATGVILVLLGMRYVRKGLDRLFGNQLVNWLQQMTNNRYKAFFGGMVAGAIAPSSSAIAMLSVQMLNQTALNAGRMLAVVLGANVGITISVQLLAFRLQDYSGVFLLTAVTSIAYAIVRDSTRSGKTPVQSPELEVEEAWLAEKSGNKKQIGPRQSVSDQKN
jgi:phosphate:Na+ symporter